MKTGFKRFKWCECEQDIITKYINDKTNELVERVHAHSPWRTKEAIITRIVRTRNNLKEPGRHSLKTYPDDLYEEYKRDYETVGEMKTEDPIEESDEAQDMIIDEPVENNSINHNDDTFEFTFKGTASQFRKLFNHE